MLILYLYKFFFENFKSINYFYTIFHIFQYKNMCFPNIEGKVKIEMAVI